MGKTFCIRSSAVAVLLATTCGASFAQTSDQAIGPLGPRLGAKTKVSPGTAVLRGTVSVEFLERERGNRTPGVTSAYSNTNFTIFQGSSASLQIREAKAVTASLRTYGEYFNHNGWLHDGGT